MQYDNYKHMNKYIVYKFIKKEHVKISLIWKTIYNHMAIFFIISDPDFIDLLNNSASGVNLISDKMKFCK